MPAINEVRAAALEYIGTVFAVTGWGNVFADLHEDIENPVRRRVFQWKVSRGERR